MRDRTPLSQTSEMVCDGARLRVIANNNPCLIHWGQHWSDTDACEREMYLEDVELVLREGMDFLRDEGISIGCYANRYMRLLDQDGAPTEKSYAQSW